MTKISITNSKLFRSVVALFSGSRLKNEDPNCFMHIYLDVTHHCNARCLFCFNDWEKLRPENMSAAIFEKCFRLAPFAQKQEFYLSCLFEPTLHPEFFDLLRAIDPALRNKIQFTTNLLKKIADDDLEFLANAGFGLVNISIETLDEERYKKLMGVQRTHFFENLERLAGYKKRAGTSTEFRFLTMILNDNREELPAIAKRTMELFPNSRHEFRTPYFFVKSENRIVDRNLLVTDIEYKQSIASLQKIRPYAELKNDDPLTVERYDEILGNTPLEALYLIQQEGVLPKTSLRIAADGTGIRDLASGPEPFDLKELDDPRDILTEPVYADDESEIESVIRVEKMRDPCLLLDVTLTEGRWLYVRGVLFRRGKRAAEAGEWFFVLNNDRSLRFKAICTRSAAMRFEGLMDLSAAKSPPQISDPARSAIPAVSLCKKTQNGFFTKRLSIKA